jgi:hypothetical protein
MMHWLKRCGLMVSAAAFAAHSYAGEIGAEGRKLAAFLDSLSVEHHWIAGQHVEWRTGDPDGKPVSDTGPHSHCSAFAASACQKLGIYLLHPPEHPQLNLANAQYDWLHEKGRESGWNQLQDPAEAQEHANRGDVVLAVFKAPEGKHGHIAILRPSVRSRAEIEQDGPEEIQAGIDNFRDTTVKNGFRHHPGAWKDRKIEFFWHPAVVSGS